MNTKPGFPASKLVPGVLLALIFGIALWLRAYLPHDQVFADNLVKFTANDADYHMRLVDNLLHHLSHPISFDPYTYFPHGTANPWPPFFDWLLACTIQIISLGSPSPHLVDTVGVYYPAVLGALTIIPVYFIGKELFNRWVGIIAAGLVAIMPSEFLSRSLLGATDHHVGEVLFTSLTMLFLILAIKSARNKRPALSSVLHGDWSTAARPMLYSLLAGFSLGIYLVTWVGGLLFVLVLFSYFVIQSIQDHLKGEPIEYLAEIAGILFVVAAAISLPFTYRIYTSPLYLPAFAVAILAPLALVYLSGLLRKRGLPAFSFPLAVLALGIVVVLLVYAIDPSFLKSFLQKLGIFTPAGASLTIEEVKPLIFAGENYSLAFAWGTLNTGFFISFIAFGILAFLTVKRADAGKTLLLVWSALIFLATLGQRRFEYYYTVNVALLSAYCSWQVLAHSGFKPAADTPPATGVINKTKARGKKKASRRFRLGAVKPERVFALLLVSVVVFFPSIGPAIKTARTDPLIVSSDWYDAMYWLRDNTPDPFDDPSFYYGEYQAPVEGQNYDYPDSAYGVMAWWDYGHEISRLAHRIPVSNPFQQGAVITAQFFTSQDATSASQIMDDLGAKYVVLDSSTVWSKYGGVVSWSGKNFNDFYEVYYQMVAGQLKPVYFFYPEYYRSAVVRLYNFDGRSPGTQKSVVVSYQHKVDSHGVKYKEIVTSQDFPNYADAQAYVAAQKSGNFSIGGLNPFISPVTLEPMSQYSLIYSSNTLLTPWLGTADVPSIKIFEYHK